MGYDQNEIRSYENSVCISNETQAMIGVYNENMTHTQMHFRKCKESDNPNPTRRGEKFCLGEEEASEWLSKNKFMVFRNDVHVDYHNRDKPMVRRFRLYFEELLKNDFKAMAL